MKRLTYISRFSQPLAASDLEQLARAAAEKNRRLDITGVLVASGGLFYQVLEGPQEHVDALYFAIAQDERHTDVLLLSSDEPISERRFPDWAMQVVDLDAASHVRLFPLKALVKSVFDQQMLVRNMIWAIERTIQHEMKVAVSGDVLEKT